jgi:FtsZ-binding cell division protein ZapB
LAATVGSRQDAQPGLFCKTIEDRPPFLPKKFLSSAKGRELGKAVSDPRPAGRALSAFTPKTIQVHQPGGARTPAAVAERLAGQEQTTMIREHRALIFMVAAALGIWGCAKVNPTASREAERLKFLEARVTKLEDDFRTAAAARDLWKQKTETVEKERNMLQRQIPPLVRERDDLKSQLAARLTERDNLQAQYERFRKEIRSLLGQADAAAATLGPPQPVSAATAAPTPGQS